MTKNGEGKNHPHELSKKDYQKALEHEIQHFLSALRHYAEDEPSKSRDHYLTTMENHLRLMMSAIPEINRSGMHKEAVIVEKAYHAYIAEQSSENYTCLENAIEALRNYNE